MLTLDCHITIEGTKRVSLDYVNGISVDTSISSLTNTAKLVVPRRMLFNKKDIREYIKREDKIKIEFGYAEYGLQTMFEGYVTKVGSNTPITIECENEAFLFKKNHVKDLYFANFNLKDFIKTYATFIKDAAVDDIDLGELRISGDVMLSQVFDHLKKKFPLNLFFRDGKFYGILNQTSLIKDNNVNFINLHYGVNTIDDSMVYTAAEDILVAIIAKAILKDNKKLEVTEPASATKGTYEFKTFYSATATTENDLRNYAKQILTNFKKDKMEGDILCFGVPLIKIGDFITLHDEDNPERDGKSFAVESVSYTFDQGGFRQKIKPGAEYKL